jgi:outer membrane protein OmpA-like peptidoglycan-associated protein
MNISRIGLCAAAALAGLVPAAAMAEASRLQLIIGGEAYDGPPRFEVTFNGTVVGEAAVETAIDTVSVGRFAEAEDRHAHVQSFEFTIPEDLFAPDGEVRVRLTNEAYGGEGSGRDRNLYLAAVAVNGRAVTVSGLATADATGTKDSELLGEFLVLYDGNEEGVSMAPGGGWPDPAATPSVAAADQVATAGSVDADVDPGLPIPRAPAIAIGSTTPVVAEEPAALETASVAGGGDIPCSRDEIYNVVGFNESSNDLTPRLQERLDQIIADIGDERCTLQITGYSRPRGDHATNALFAVERAQNVLSYLRSKGLQFRRATAAGAGATERFGERASDNRRVVITVLP